MAESSSVKPTSDAKVTGLIPMAHGGELQWVHLACKQADLMFARASEPVVSSQQAVLFYFYSPKLVALREYLISAGVRVSPFTYPDYMPKGEVRVEDPDGYTLLIGQAG